jgi:hypothetical protein
VQYVADRRADGQGWERTGFRGRGRSSGARDQRVLFNVVGSAAEQHVGDAGAAWVRPIPWISMAQKDRGRVSRRRSTAGMSVRDLMSRPQARQDERASSDGLRPGGSHASSCVALARHVRGAFGQHFWPVAPATLGSTSGTANTLVHVKGRGIMLREPSVVAVDSRTGQVLAVGEDAKRMVGRTPAQIKAVRPLRDGVIADFDTTEAMLHHFIEKVLTRRRLGAPAGGDRRAFGDHRGRAPGGGGGGAPGRAHGRRW